MNSNKKVKLRLKFMFIILHSAVIGFGEKILQKVVILYNHHSIIDTVVFLVEVVP